MVDGITNFLFYLLYFIYSKIQRHFHKFWPIVGRNIILADFDADRAHYRWRDVFCSFEQQSLTSSRTACNLPPITHRWAHNTYFPRFLVQGSFKCIEGWQLTIVLKWVPTVGSVVIVLWNFDFNNSIAFRTQKSAGCAKISYPSCKTEIWVLASTIYNRCIRISKFEFLLHLLIVRLRLIVSCVRIPQNFD